MTDSPSTFFDEGQRLVLEAAMARIIPADDGPGAVEAGAVSFLDRYLSGLDFIYAKPDGSGFETLSGKPAQAWTRRIDALRRRYVEGLADLDARARTRSNGQDGFAGLDTDSQDAILGELERGDSGPDYTTPGHGLPVEPALQQTSAEMELDFFPLLCLHTRQGFYADPIYGGNRDRAGWRVIGFPGPASLAEVHTGTFSSLDHFADNRVHPGTEED